MPPGDAPQFEVPDARPRYSAQEKPFVLLELFSEERPSWKLSELAARTGMPAPTCLRAIRVLVRFGFLQRNGDAYGLGVRTASLGHLFRAQHPARDVALPHMRHLCEASGLSVQWVVRDGTSAGVYLHVLPPREAVRLYVAEGRRAPLHAGASTRLLLALAPDAVTRDVLRQPLRKLTNQTPIQPTELRRLLRLARKTWLAASIGELEPHTVELAAPVFDGVGDAIAALSVAGEQSRVLEVGATEKVFENLVEAAAAISRALGYAGPWRTDIAGLLQGQPLALASVRPPTGSA